MAAGYKEATEDETRLAEGPESKDLLCLEIHRLPAIAEKRISPDTDPFSSLTSYLI